MTDEKKAVLWQAIAAVAKDQNNRNLVSVGPHKATLTVTGTVDDETASCKVEVALLVKPDTERASSHTPGIEKIIAWILTMVNKKTRESILATMMAVPEKDIPDVPSEDLKRIEEIAAHLRTTTRSPVKGAITALSTVSDCQ